jgi:hypothetical protein
MTEAPNGSWVLGSDEACKSTFDNEGMETRHPTGSGLFATAHDPLTGNAVNAAPAKGAFVMTGFAKRLPCGPAAAGRLRLKR